MKCIVFYIGLSLQSGRLLPLIEEDCQIYVRQMIDLKRTSARDCTKLFWQTVLILLGASNISNRLQGVVVPEGFDKSLSDMPPAVATFRGQQAFLNVMFGNHRAGADLCISNDGFHMQVAPMNPLIQGELFMGGLSCFAMAREGKASKYVKQAKRTWKVFKEWNDKGNPYAKHSFALLDAELSALNKDQKGAVKRYQSAISFATRGGFRHDAALASERLGELALEMGDKEEAVYRFKEAVRYYNEWGAKRKVDSLQDKHSHLWPAITEIFMVPGDESERLEGSSFNAGGSFNSLY